jgi:hypothetical protein
MKKKCEITPENLTPFLYNLDKGLYTIELRIKGTLAEMQSRERVYQRVVHASYFIQQNKHSKKSEH